MTAPYTLLVGDFTVHLLSKFVGDASIVIGARAKEGEPEVTTQSLAAAQREKELQREKEQLPIAAPPPSAPDSPNQAQTPTKAKNLPPLTTPSGPAVRDFWGLIGIINLHQGPYLITIAAVTKIGRLLGQHDIFLVSKVILQPISAVPLYQLNEEEKKREVTLVEKLTTLIEESAFHFSYTCDLTNTQQRIAALPKESPPKRASQTADLRFYWNHHLQVDFERLHLEAWTLPVIQGFIAIFDGVKGADPHLRQNQPQPPAQATAPADAFAAAPPSLVPTDDKRRFQYALISRRSCVRTGPRLHMRGADYEGNAATFSEQEQIVSFGGAISSFVQTRGSIPLVWHQLDRKQMKPKPVVLQSPAQRRTCRRHFALQRQLYGGVTVVSLLDSHGIEMDLAEAYETYVRLIADKGLSFVGFDFHEICKGGKYENISVLLQQLRSDLAEHHFFLQVTDGKIAAQQTGVVRINCLDCLDRTNVVQSVFAHHVLRSQLETMGVLTGGEAVETMTEFEAAWKNAWADNADRLSMLYTGTGALKTAFTRTGQWTVSGALLDGMTSAKRYVNQTVYDDEKLQLQHLLLGEHEVFHNNANLEECETDGVFRFKVWKQQLAAQPDPVVLEIDIMRGLFTHYALKDFTKRVRSLTRLYRVVRAQRNFKRLRVIFAQNPAPKDYDFRDPESREKCVQALRSAVAVAAQKAGADASTELMPLLPLSKYERPVKVFLGSWNLANETSPSFEGWVPRDQELYAFAVQNCDYRKDDFYFSPASHFCYALHQYLGPSRFERVATAAIGGLVTVIFVTSDLAPFVTSTEIMPLRYQLAETPKPTPATSPQSSFFGRLLGRSVEPDQRARSPASPSSAENEGEVKAHALCLHIHDTGIAFLHHYNSAEATPRIDGIDLYASYDHLFSIGRINAPGGRWLELVRHPKADENTFISWRSSAAPRLFAVQPTSPFTSASIAPLASPTTGRLRVSASIESAPSSLTDVTATSLNQAPVASIAVPVPIAAFTPQPQLPSSPANASSALSGPPANASPTSLASPAVATAPAFADSTVTSIIASPSAEHAAEIQQSARKSSRAVAFLNELAASPRVVGPAPDGTLSNTPPANSLLEQSTPGVGGIPRRKSSRAGEFLQQMNKADPSTIVVKDDSGATNLPASGPPPVRERDRKSMHRRAASDGTKIFGAHQKVVPLGLTCTLNAICDFYRPNPACTIMLAGPRSPSLKLASSVTPLKGEIFLLLEAPFINPIRTKLSPKSATGWAWEDIEINPFITDPQYLRLRYILITAWDIDVLGTPVLIGTGRLPLAQVMDGPSEPRVALFSDDSPSGVVTFAALARVASIGRKPSSGKIIQQSP